MKNWTIKEAVEAINKNDAAAIKEISKHFPMFFLAIARNDLQALAAMMPEKFTVRRLQMTDAAVDDTDEGVDPQTDADAEDASEDAGEADLSSMSTKELMKLCDKRGIKVPHYGKNKQFYLDALNGASGAKADAEDDADEDGDGEDESNPYEGKNAMELYKMCKKRGIKCEAKKKAAYYADLLTKDDAKSDEGEDESEDDGWGDEDEAQEEPKKAAKSSKKAEKADKKPAAKAAKKETKKDEADDDEDWDI